MKLYGVFGKGSGKVGNSVWAISGGEQIVRPYNPNVTNPNTAAQIAQRAKLKLMSQLAAAMEPGIMFVKNGLVSARNQFVSKNIGLATYGESAPEQASIDLTKIQLTPSNVDMRPLGGCTLSAGILNIQLADDNGKTFTRVVYVIYKKTAGGELAYYASKSVTEPGVNGTYPTSMSFNGSHAVVYAFGVNDKNSNATIRYENYVAEQGEADATLDTLKLFKTADYGLTKSVAVEVTEV